MPIAKANFKIKTSNSAPSTSNENVGGLSKIHDKIMYFKDRNVNITFPGETARYKKEEEWIEYPLKFKILPSFDYGLSENDKAFPTSVAPFMDLDSGEIDPELHCPSFTNWGVPLKVHRQVFRSGRSFISPLTLCELWGVDYDDGDPIVDLLRYVYSCDNHAWKSLKDIKARPDDKYSPKVLSRTGEEILLNIVAADASGKITDKSRNSVMMIGITCYNKLKEDLVRVKAGVEDVSELPLEDRYIFGDPFSPNGGLMTRIVTIPKTKTEFGYKRIVFDHGKSKFNPEAEPEIMKAPLDLNNDHHKSLLSGRINFYDLDVIKIPSYEDIIEIIKEEGQIPHELLQNACGHRCDVGQPNPAQKNATYSTGQNPTPPPAAPAAPTPPPAAPMAPPAGNKKYWVIIDGSSPELKSEAEIDEMLFEAGTGNATVNLMSEDQSSGWKTPADFGFAPKPQAPAAPAAPAAPTPPPAAPAAPTPPSAPAEPAEPAASSEGSDKLTPEEEAEYEELRKKADDNTIESDAVSRYLELAAKVGA
jgi:hypothetical protein